MISGATIVYLSAVDWASPWHGPQELAARMGAAGNRVIYVETVGWRRPRAFDVPRVLGRLRRALRSRRAAPPPPAPGVELVSPLLIPGARSRLTRAVNRRLMTRALRGRAGDGRPRILWAYTPANVTVDLVGALGEDLALYHCTQHHAGRPLAPPGTAAIEAELMDRVDLVIADGIRLFEERVGRHPFVYRIPSGANADDHAGASPPAWTAALRRPVVGFLGTVDHRIDPSLISAAATAHPEWTVLVVGPVTDIDVSELRALPNVEMRGHVPIGEVPGVLAAFDVGLMPYADIEMTAYTYPAKLHQYLAAGLPIVSTPLPDLDDFPGLVEQAPAAGFVAAVERALAAPPDADARRRVASANTWAARAEATSAVIAAHLAGTPPPSSRDVRG